MERAPLDIAVEIVRYANYDSKTIEELPWIVRGLREKDRAALGVALQEDNVQVLRALILHFEISREDIERTKKSLIAKCIVHVSGKVLDYFLDEQNVNLSPGLWIRLTLFAAEKKLESFVLCLKYSEQHVDIASLFHVLYVNMHLEHLMYLAKNFGKYKDDFIDVLTDEQKVYALRKCTSVESLRDLWGVLNVDTQSQRVQMMIIAADIIFTEAQKIIESLLGEPFSALVERIDGDTRYKSVFVRYIDFANYTDVPSNP